MKCVSWGYEQERRSKYGRFKHENMWPGVGGGAPVNTSPKGRGTKRKFQKQSSPHHALAAAVVPALIPYSSSGP